MWGSELPFLMGTLLPESSELEDQQWNKISKFQKEWREVRLRAHFVLLAKKKQKTWGKRKQASWHLVREMPPQQIYRPSQRKVKYLTVKNKMSIWKITGMGLNKRRKRSGIWREAAAHEMINQNYKTMWFPVCFLIKCIYTKTLKG